jgi:hypothetical protein
MHSVFPLKLGVTFDNASVSLGRWKHRFKTEFKLMLHRAKPTLRVELENWFCNFA